MKVNNEYSWTYVLFTLPIIIMSFMLFYTMPNVIEKLKEINILIICFLLITLFVGIILLLTFEFKSIKLRILSTILCELITIYTIMLLSLIVILFGHIIIENFMETSVNKEFLLNSYKILMVGFTLFIWYGAGAAFNYLFKWKKWVSYLEFKQQLVSKVDFTYLATTLTLIVGLLFGISGDNNDVSGALIDYCVTGTFIVYTLIHAYKRFDMKSKDFIEELNN